MKYSLRSLMIFVTLLALTLGGESRVFAAVGDVS